MKIPSLKQLNNCLSEGFFVPHPDQERSRSQGVRRKTITSDDRAGLISMRGDIRNRWL